MTLLVKDVLNKTGSGRERGGRENGRERREERKRERL
jgi:hypothetical protein